MRLELLLDTVVYTLATLGAGAFVGFAGIVLALVAPMFGGGVEVPADCAGGMLYNECAVLDATQVRVR